MKIILTENQYNRIFLGDVLNIEGVYINEQNKNSFHDDPVRKKINETIILPGANAGEIQEFLKIKGFYKGNVDYDFGDKSAEAFAKYYKKFGPMKTLRELYDELKVMRYPVGEEFGFGPKMAKVISDLIKKKESKSGDQVIQTSQKCTRSCGEMSEDEFNEALNFVFSPKGKSWLLGKDSETTKTDDYLQPGQQLVPDWKLNNRECMRCHTWNHGGKQEWQNIQTYARLNPDFVNSEKFQYYKQWKDDVNILYQQMVPWDEIIYKYRHEIIDVLTVVAYFFGPIGVGISIALEGFNGVLYAQEGDWTSAIMCWVFMAIPAGGPLIRRLTAPVAKNIVKYFKNLSKITENMGLSEREIKKKIAELNKTLSKTEKEIVEQMTDPKVIKEITETTSKREAKQKVIQNISQNDELYKNYLRWERGFGKGSKFLKELFNPTAFEKFMYAGAIMGAYYLDKSGKMEDFGQFVLKQLIKLGWVEDTSVEVEKAMEEELNEIVEKFTNPNFGDITDEERDKLAIDFGKELDTTLNLYVKVHEYDLPGKVELIKSELPVKEKLLKKLEGVSDDNLRDFDNYKWAQLCKGKNKISVSSNITPEIEEYLNDKMFNIRRIKSSDLGSNYQYASDEDGLWYYQKTGEDSWTLVTDCMALLKIETAMEKELDSDIDTEAELFDLYKDDIDIEYKDF
jgi:hypothetical protein